MYRLTVYDPDGSFRVHMCTDYDQMVRIMTHAVDNGARKINLIVKEVKNA